MEKLKIAVGTTSEQKGEYLKEVLDELKIKADLIMSQARSGVAEQPKTTEETELGSQNRAREALSKNSEADFAIGIEVGYNKNSRKDYEMFCWVTIVDKNDYQVSSQSYKFLLPRYHQELLNKDLYVGDNLDGYLKNDSNNYTKKYIDEVVRYRKPFITTALKNALVGYMNREDFQ